PATRRVDPGIFQAGGAPAGGSRTNGDRSDRRGSRAAGRSGRGDMSPNDWTSLAEWVKDFRFLHAQAKKGKLDSRDRARYAQDREILSKALLIAQRLAIRPGKTPRQTLRVGLELPVALVGNGRSEESTTLDLGVGGFPILVDKPMSVMQRYQFALTMSEGLVRGRVRVVNVQRKGKPFRVAFAFEELPASDSERIGTEAFDAALAMIPPD